MAFPNYFSKFPDLKYPIRMNRAGVTENVNIKDHFHLLKMRETVFAQDNLYDKYYIKNGQRPDQVSRELYGNSEYYWIILQVNEIIDVYNQWPLSSYELDAYILKKYGSYEKAAEPHHYETIETYDEDGNLVLPGRGGPGPDRGGLAQSGLHVPPNYTFSYPSFPGSPTTITLSGFEGVTPSCTEITNRQYEYDLNEDKSQIWVLQQKYLVDFVAEVDRYAKKISDIDTELGFSDR